MDPTAIPIFALADRRLAWIDQRQALLSRNIANIDTPGYRPSDTQPFQRALSNAGFDVAPARTDPAHLAGTIAATRGAKPIAGERAPDGNAVSLDDELLRVADTDGAHELVTDLYRKYLSLFRMALGH